jgi:hypothetical protein
MSTSALTRRGFLRSSAAFGVLAASTGLHGCAKAPANLINRHRPGVAPSQPIPFPSGFTRIDGASHGAQFPAGIRNDGNRIRLVTASSAVDANNAYLSAQEGADTFTMQASESNADRFFNGRRVRAASGEIALSNDGIQGRFSRFSATLTDEAPDSTLTFTSGHVWHDGDQTLLATTADYDWSQFAMRKGKVIALTDTFDTLGEQTIEGTNPTGVALISARNELLVVGSGEWTDTTITLHVLDATTLAPKKTITVTRDHIGQLHDTVLVSENGDYAYLGTSDLSGLVYRVDLNTGEIKELQTGEGFVAGLTLSANVLYAANFDRLSVTAASPDFADQVEIPLDFNPGPLTALTSGGVRLAGQENVVDLIPG